MARRLRKQVQAFALAAAILCAWSGGAAAQDQARGHPLAGAASDYRPLYAAMGEARYLLLGESTHGTHEFYAERARITLELARQGRLGAVVIEGDWPATERVNRYVRGIGDDTGAQQATADFRRFPRWLWRNAEFSRFVEALRAHNLAQPADRRIGVYGMDIYGLYDSVRGVQRYVDTHHGSVAAQVRRDYRCLTRHADATAYGVASRKPANVCERDAAAVVRLLEGLPEPEAVDAREAHVSAVANAASIVGGEAYFRAVYAGVLAWNVRDRAMVRAVEAVEARQPGAIAVWAHNSHVGDARATDASRRGEINLGQILREAHGPRVFNVGFITYAGAVHAARQQNGPAGARPLPPALPDSVPALLHASGAGNALYLKKDFGPALSTERLDLAVGVIYRPERADERHYYATTLTDQFDAVVFIDTTTAIDPAP